MDTHPTPIVLNKGIWVRIRGRDIRSRPSTDTAYGRGVHGTTELKVSLRGYAPLGRFLDSGDKSPIVALHGWHDWDWTPHVLLTRTFLHLPDVGPQRERLYWEDGVLSWDDLLNRRDLFDDGPPPPLEAELTLSRDRLADGDARWFEERLGAEQAWRVAAEFDDGRIAYLDIETDGSPGDHLPDGADRPGGTTVLSVWDGFEARVFLRGSEMDELPEYLSRYKVLCTFNGKSFDLPYLEHCYGKDFFKGAHLDLRPITRAVGLTGGLKKIEKLIGIERPKAIARYTGWDAVKLWGAYTQGRKDAIEPLARYNLADSVNLQAVLRSAYNHAVALQSLPFRRFDLLQEEGLNDAVDRAIAQLMAKAH